MFRMHPELQYLSLIKNIIHNGTRQKGRNGYTKTLIGSSMRFPLLNNQIPLLTTKKLAWKSCLKELLWFINGETDNTILQTQNVKIWNDNASRDFLDSRELYQYEENDLGPIYGYQWRNFNKKYVNKKKYNRDKKIAKFFGKGKKDIDQLQNIIHIQSLVLDHKPLHIYHCINTIMENDDTHVSHRWLYDIHEVLFADMGLNIKQANKPKIQIMHFSFSPYYLNLLEDNVESLKILIIV